MMHVDICQVNQTLRNIDETEVKILDDWYKKNIMPIEEDMRMLSLCRVYVEFPYPMKSNLSSYSWYQPPSFACDILPCHSIFPRVTIAHIDDDADKQLLIRS
jgi:hypothetical protein